MRRSGFIISTNMGSSWGIWCKSGGFKAGAGVFFFGIAGFGRVLCRGGCGCGCCWSCCLDGIDGSERGERGAGGSGFDEVGTALLELAGRGGTGGTGGTS